MEMDQVKDQDKAATQVANQPAAEAPAAEMMVNDQPRTFESGELEVGSVTHQGDVIIMKLGERPKQLKVRVDRQLAEGNTQGSRHILVGGELWDGEISELQGLIKKASGKDVQEKYIGPVFRGGELTHPEHGNQTFPADELFVCVYQRNLDADEREERVRD